MNPDTTPSNTDPMLVVLPFWEKDAQLTAKLLRLAQKLDGMGLPVNFDCLLVYDREVSPENVAAVRAEAEKYFHTTSGYVYDPPHRRTWPFSNNHVFQRGAWHVYNHLKRPFLWLEADCCPIRAGWLTLIADEYRKGKKPIMGNIVPVMGHCNGVAVYPAKMVELSPEAMLVTAYPWDLAMKERTIGLTHRANHLIMHVWATGAKGEPLDEGDGPAPTFPDWATVERLVNFQAALFHRCKDGSLTDRLMEGPPAAKAAVKKGKA